MVGKVELIFACALHTISVFFYLFIFNVRVPAHCAECSIRAHGSGLGDNHVACRWMSRRCGSPFLHACWALCLCLGTASATCTRPSSSSSWSTRAPPPLAKSKRSSGMHVNTKATRSSMSAIRHTVKHLK